MTPRAGARAVLLAALAAVWAIAAYLLWQTRVPSSLRLPHVDVHRYFTPAQLHAASSYGRFTEIVWALAVIVELVVFALYAKRGPRFMRESAAGPVGTAEYSLRLSAFRLQIFFLSFPFVIAGRRSGNPCESPAHKAQSTGARACQLIMDHRVKARW